MANDPSKAIKEMIKKLEEVKESILDEIEDVGEFAAETIKKRTRLGYGVEDHGDRKKKLSPLTEGYVKARARKQLSGKTTKKKSNLTQSGDMLDDLEAKKTADNKVEIGFKSKEAEDKATWNTDKGRPFNNLSKAEQKQVKEYIEKKVEKNLKKLS